MGEETEREIGRQIGARERENRGEAEGGIVSLSFERLVQAGLSFVGPCV